MSASVRLGEQPDGSVLIALAPDEKSPAFAELVSALGVLPETCGERWRVYSVPSVLLRGDMLPRSLHMMGIGIDFGSGVGRVELDREPAMLPPAWQAWVLAELSAWRHDDLRPLVTHQPPPGGRERLS